MFVQESPDALHAAVRGATYYFCSEYCMKTFTAPELELRLLKRMTLLGLLLGVPILILSYVAVAPGWVLLLLATPVQFVAGWRFYQGAWNAIRMRSSNMDFLIAVGTSAAYFYSLAYVLFPTEFPYGGLYFDTSAAIITLILMGKLLEHTVRGKATDAITRLLRLQPTTATVVRDGGAHEEVPIEEVQVGDVFLVRPGEKVATDGTVVDGHSSVDEKMVTGESVPVEKAGGAPVIGGTLNGTGALKVRAARVGADTTLAKIVQVVQDAQTSKGPVERLVNTISTYFVPAVVLTALVSFVSWTAIGHKPVSFAFTAAVAVLIIACPCALGLATPAAIVVGAGKGAENGILIKGGEYLERMQKVDTVVFDKTGTLTEGTPSVTDVISLDPSFSEGDVLKLAAVAETRSEHPLASAVLKKAGEELGLVPEPDSFESVPGEGVRASYAGMQVFLGRAAELEGEHAATLDRLAGQGKTTMLLTVDGRAAGLVAAADTPKPFAKETVQALAKMKLDVVMLSGDDERTAAAMASQLGIGRCIAGVSPAGKSETIKRLQEEEGRSVAMVGDGINDAPALAQADVGIAIGSGSDIAIETGGLILMRDDPRDVVAGIQLARRTMGKVRQNLFWAFVYNVALIPVAAGLLYLVVGVLLNPILAGAAMAMSSVTVVTNSLTLRRFTPKM
ncbi:MAG: cadmium-translocating P-type ATPase [Nitrososphaerota archaeon]|nr:cadmium-translocating P-type ATPase [Nitrososphaerota archaeon]